MLIIGVHEVPCAVVVEVLQCGLRLETNQRHARLLERLNLRHLLLREQDLLIAQREVRINLIREDGIPAIRTHKDRLLLQ